MYPYKYPRVTEIIEATTPSWKKLALMKWRKRMEKIHGVEGAALEKEKKLANGTALHKSIANYLLGIEEENPHYLMKNVKAILSIVKNSPILKVEKFVVSHKHQYQGTCDCICEWEGLPTVIDWTSNNGVAPKKKAWIEHKFIQAGAYSLAEKEMHKTKIEALSVIVIGEKKAQIFTDPCDHWESEFISRLADYHTASRLVPC